MFREPAGVQIGRTLPADDGKIVVGIPFEVLPYAFLGVRDGGMQRITIETGSVRDGCLMQNGHDVALSSDVGTVSVFDETEPLWSFDHAVEEQLWCQHPQVWLGSQDSVVTRMTKRGVQVWTHDLSEDVLGPQPAAPAM